MDDEEVMRLFDGDPFPCPSDTVGKHTCPPVFVYVSASVCPFHERPHTARAMDSESDGNEDLDSNPSQNAQTSDDVLRRRARRALGRNPAHRPSHPRPSPPHRPRSPSPVAVHPRAPTPPRRRTPHHEASPLAYADEGALLDRPWLFWRDRSPIPAYSPALLWGPPLQQTPEWTAFVAALQARAHSVGIDPGSVTYAVFEARVSPHGAPLYTVFIPAGAMPGPPGNGHVYVENVLAPTHAAMSQLAEEIARVACRMPHFWCGGSVVVRPAWDGGGAAAARVVLRLYTASEAFAYKQHFETPESCVVISPLRPARNPWVFTPAASVSPVLQDGGGGGGRPVGTPQRRQEFADMPADFAALDSFMNRGFVNRGARVALWPSPLAFLNHKPTDVIPPPSQHAPSPWGLSFHVSQ